jgi:serine/threonine-protein kinase
MASVWAAQHLSLRSEVAVKLIDPRIADQAEALQRFHREARAVAALRSNHVVQIFDHGIDEGVPFMVMELLQGENLAEHLERQTRLGAADVLRIMTHVGRAMNRAHAAGITHRDLKPDNVFLIEDDDAGRVAKVLDFGVAKISGQVGISHRFPTRSGVILGTPWYMSPEQMKGEATVDFRSDLWAMAVITFECLVGERPFEDPALGKLAEKICLRDPPIPSALAPLPPEFDAWFAKALAKNREERFASAREMIEALDRALRPAMGADTRHSVGQWGDADDRVGLPNLGSVPGAPAAEDAQAHPDEQALVAADYRASSHKGGGTRNLLRYFADGMLVCAMTLLVAFAILVARRYWADCFSGQLNAER